MKKKNASKSFWVSLLAGLLVGGLTMLLTTGFVLAAPQSQEGEPDLPSNPNGSDCQECHLDITENWSHSPHAHAFDDPVFQESWVGQGEPDNCLACHTTNYIASTGEYEAEGIVCESCHGEAPENHPPEVIPVEADVDYCGSCHTTTLGEWRTTGHMTADVGCMDCHDPHSQENLFENPDELCINCHQEEEMGDYLNDLHVQKDIGCVDCHTLVIPPEELPDDGIVPTGHAFDITPATCVACHTDALHAGFSLPGYENGATAANGGEAVETEEMQPAFHEEEEVLNAEQRVQALETALASRNLTTLFQGGVVGLVLGGSTAWVVARNVRRMAEDDEDDEENVDGE